MSTPATLYGLRPFVSAPDPRRYFPAHAVEEARRRVGRCIERGEGPALVVGGAGCGKSLLLEVLAAQFSETRSVARLTGAQICTRRTLLQTILFELGLPFRGLDEGELRLAILQHLRGLDAMKRQVLLLVDEADALPCRLLEELRVLTGVVSEGQPLVQLVLVGRPALEERFADPQLDAFSQRLAVRAYLSPLTRDETFRYVRSQVAAVGRRPIEWFTEGCLESLYQATDGIPRLINQLGDQLVVGAEGQGALPLGADDVQRAWAELQQLPTPWNHRVGHVDSDADGAGMVEFSGLDEEVATHAVSADEKGRDECVHQVEGELELAVLEDDDLPASIPFSVHGEAPRSAADRAVAEGHEVVDPFAEPFDEEEVIIDPYASFETQLLAAAPQVVNGLDRALAAELGRVETAALAFHRSAPSTALIAAAEVDWDDTPDTELDEPESGQLGVDGAYNQTGLCGELRDEETHVDSMSDEEVVADAEERGEAESRDGAERFHPIRVDMPAPAAPRGDLLIVEEDDDCAPRVVPSRQFRRLFSALETGTALGAPLHRRLGQTDH